MPILEIFEPALCCPTGVCGPEPDKALLDLQNTINLAKKAGIEVKRYAINQTPLAFTSNPVVRQFIMTEGPGQLPITLYAGQIVKKGAYPTAEELADIFPEMKNSPSLGIFS